MIPAPILRYLIGAALVLAAITGIVVWHNGKVSAAFTAGAAKQAQADRKAYADAETLATQRQSALVAGQKGKASTISKGTDDALRKDNARLAGDYAALRKLWAAYRADQGRAGQGRATGLTSAAGVPDDTYCPAQGWVSFDVAATAAEAADTAIAKDDAWRSWYEAQAEAWPK